MHPVLRLYEDVLSSAENVAIRTAAAAALHLRGARLGHDRRRDRERRRGLAGRRRRAGAARRGGVTCWRWELSRGDHGSTVASAPGMISHEKLTAYLETLPKGDLLMRGDSVAFPPGGCAYLHRHQGPGIRCLIEGGIRIDTHGRSTSYGPGGAWYETGPDPVFAQAAADKAEPLHPRDDPAARADRQKLDRISQRGRQGEAEDAELQDLRRRADRSRRRSESSSFRAASVQGSPAIARSAPGMTVHDHPRPPAGFFRHQGGGARAAARCGAARSIISRRR